MNNLQIFKNEQFGEIRTIEENGKVLFCGSDVAKALGYAIPSKAVNTHCKGVSKMEVPTNGGVQEMLFIPEGDIYRLITHSKLPSAEQFEGWVFDEVLPSIRKTGGYSLNGIPLIDDPSKVASLINSLRNVMKDQRSAPTKIAAMAGGICHQFGVDLPSNFVEVSPWEQIMIEEE